MFSSTITALVTPWKNGEIDVNSFENLLARQSAGGITDVLVAGSTGEGALLSDEEYAQLLKIASNFETKFQVMACCSSISTSGAVHKARLAEKNGASAILVPPPAYVKPSQAGLIEHVKAIYSAVDLPIMLYSIPGRVGVDFDYVTVEQLAQLDRIIAIKDSGSDISRIAKIASNTDLMVFAGNDSSSLAARSYGAKGVVSVVSNLAPSQVLGVQEDWLSGNCLEAAIKIKALYPLIWALDIETNPVVIKHALSYAGLCTPELRLPLLPLKPNQAEAVESALDMMQVLF